MYLLKRQHLATSTILLLVTGCANDNLLCEDILEVKHQHQVCNQLSKTINNDKTNPQQAMTARNRFESECQDLRYYRDDYDTICKKGETPIPTPEQKVRHD